MAARFEGHVQEFRAEALQGRSFGAVVKPKCFGKGLFAKTKSLRQGCAGGNLYAGTLDIHGKPNGKALHVERWA